MLVSLNKSLSIRMTSAPLIQSTIYCLRFQNYDYQTLTHSVTLAALIFNTLSFPATIVMNALLIIAVKTRHRLQIESNLLLTSLAGTDLLKGLATLPDTIAADGGRKYTLLEREESLDFYRHHHWFPCVVCFTDAHRIFSCEVSCGPEIADFLVPSCTIVSHVELTL